MHLRAGWQRRVVACVVTLLPIGISVASAVSNRQPGIVGTAAGLSLAGLAIVVTCMNLYGVLLRPLLGRPGSSAAPILGTVAGSLAMIVAFGSDAVAILALIALVADPGNAVWFVAATWHDDALWGGVVE